MSICFQPQATCPGSDSDVEEHGVGEDDRTTQDFRRPKVREYTESTRGLQRSLKEYG